MSNFLVVKIDKDYFATPIHDAIKQSLSEGYDANESIMAWRLSIIGFVIAFNVSRSSRGCEDNSRYGPNTITLEHYFTVVVPYMSRSMLVEYTDVLPDLYSQKCVVLDLKTNNVWIRE